MLHLKLLEKQKAEPKTSRRREIIKIRDKINEIETKKKKTIQRISKTKSCFFEKTKIDKPLANLIKMRREKTQISKIRNQKQKIIKNTMEIQGIIRDYCENLHSNKLENLEETNFYILMTIQN
jgi:hypothetical protein